MIQRRDSPMRFNVTDASPQLTEPKLIQPTLVDPMRTLHRLSKFSRPVMVAAASIIVTAASASCAVAGTLFGEPACETWPTMSAESTRTWTLAFLAPLSMAYETRQKTGEDKFNYKAEAAERAMASIDSFCKDNPGKTAADGAAPYLESLVGRR